MIPGALFETGTFRKHIYVFYISTHKQKKRVGKKGRKKETNKQKKHPNNINP